MAPYRDRVHVGLAFGLCDLGIGEPELGYVSFAELEAAKVQLSLPVERDLHFMATRTISAYADSPASAEGSSSDAQTLSDPQFGGSDGSL
jgi:Protein of unknown function (DUF2958)